MNKPDLDVTICAVLFLIVAVLGIWKDVVRINPKRRSDNMREHRWIALYMGPDTFTYECSTCGQAHTVTGPESDDDINVASSECPGPPANPKRRTTTMNNHTWTTTLINPTEYRYECTICGLRYTRPANEEIDDRLVMDAPCPGSPTTGAPAKVEVLGINKPSKPTPKPEDLTLLTEFHHLQGHTVERVAESWQYGRVAIVTADNAVLIIGTTAFEAEPAVETTMPTRPDELYGLNLISEEEYERRAVAEQFEMEKGQKAQRHEQYLKLREEFGDGR